MDYVYELRRGEEVVATGHLVMGRIVAPGEAVPFGAGMATVKEVRRSFGGITRLVLELERDL